MPGDKRPVFSVITPTYKRPLLLIRAIKSVKTQTFDDYEHIIIDDANDPETERKVSEFSDNSIVFYQHTIKKGAAGSYNSGIKMARGEFILFLDDDDEYLPSFLEKLYFHFLQTDARIGFVWTGISMVLDTKTGEEELYSKVWSSKFLTKEDGLVAATTIGNGYGLCVRRECIDKTGLYDESIPMGHDADFMFRLVRKYDFETIPSVLVKIHQHNDSQLTQKGNNLLRLELRERILERHSDLLYQYPKLFFVHYKHVADLSYSLHLRKKGRRAMAGIIKNNPFRLLNYCDLLCYELLGKNTHALYYHRRLRKLNRINKVGNQN